MTKNNTSNRQKIRSMSRECYAELLSPTLTISRCCISGKSDLYHCLLPIAGAPPQVVKTACLSLHTSDRITALGVLVCWQQFILMCCHNTEFFEALHHGASESYCTFLLPDATGSYREKTLTTEMFPAEISRWTSLRWLLHCKHCLLTLCRSKLLLKLLNTVSEHLISKHSDLETGFTSAQKQDLPIAIDHFRKLTNN